VKQSEEDEEETLELEAKRLNSRDMSAGRCHLAAGLGQAMWGG